MLVGRGGGAVERAGLSIKGTGFDISAAVSKHGSFKSSHIVLSFGRDYKSRWSFLPGAFDNGIKDHMHGVNVKHVVNSQILEKNNSENQARQL